MRRLLYASAAPSRPRNCDLDLVLVSTRAAGDRVFHITTRAAKLSEEQADPAAYYSALWRDHEAD